MDSLRRRLPSPGALFLFEAAARHENFTRAAEEMNVTQPAVSRALAALEEHLGTKLFHRGKIGARLTEDGRILKEAVSAGFAQIDKGLERLDARRSGKTQITLSVSTAFTAHWLMPRISRCQAAFPDLDLRFQLIAGPISGPIGDVDIALRYVAPGDVTGRFIMHEAILPVCAPGYLRVPGGQRTFIQLEGNNPFRFSGVEGWTGAKTSAQLAFPDYAVVVQAALSGQGVAAGWLNTVAHWLKEGQLVPASDVLMVPGRVCQMITRNQPPNADIVAAFTDWLVAELQSDIEAAHAAYPHIGISRLLQ
jgi:DNA-binding transcriptional LysR family regulator